MSFDTLVKRWDKCINVGRGHVEKTMFTQGYNIIYITFYIHFDLFTDCSS
jgi:hypothetical protein